MIDGIGAATGGIKAQTQRMDALANDIANVSTTGYKPVRASTGTPDFQQAALEETGNPLDLAIEGDGFFEVKRPDGTTAYTRAGNFSLSAEGKLVTSDGMPVQPEITVPQGATAITIGTDGTVSAQLSGDTKPSELGKIELARFVNPSGLQALGDNLYSETAASGAPQAGLAGADGRGTIRQGSLEGSNVNVVEELVDMIETQRAYEVNSKMISATDEMLRNANQQL